MNTFTKRLSVLALAVIILVCALSTNVTALSYRQDAIISEMTLNGKAAAVTFSAPNGTKLIVAVYDKTTKQMLGAGVEAVGSGSQTADVNISIPTMPEKYMIKAFLLDSDNASIAAPLVRYSSSDGGLVESDKEYGDMELTSMSANEKAAQKLSFAFDGAVPSISYIILNITGYCEKFELDCENLLFIDEVTADENGEINAEFTPRETNKNSTTLLIGDLGGGNEATPVLGLVDIRISSNPTSFTYKSVPSTSEIKVMAIYADKEEADVTADITVSGLDTSSTGAKTATVEYERLTASFDYTVSYAWWQWIINILLLGFLWY